MNVELIAPKFIFEYGKEKVILKIVQDHEDTVTKTFNTEEERRQFLLGVKYVYDSFGVFFVSNGERQ